jgi:hypothetical protein
MSKNKDIYTTFEDLMSQIDPELSTICEALREIIAEIHTDFVEIVWKNQKIASYGVGPKKMSEHYTYLAPHKKHVNLGFYHGAVLQDPEYLLEGTGKRLRHIKIKNISEAERPQIKDLIQAAIAERENALA